MRLELAQFFFSASPLACPRLLPARTPPDARVGAWPAAHSTNWRLLCRARALDGVRWLVGANRTGSGSISGTAGSEYAGRSLVVRPDGVVAAALNRGERDLVWTLDRDLLAEQRAFVGSVE